MENSLLELFHCEHLAVAILPCLLIPGRKLVLSVPATVCLPHPCSKKCGNSPWGQLSLWLGTALKADGLSVGLSISQPLKIAYPSTILMAYLSHNSKGFSLSPGLVLAENLLLLGEGSLYPWTESLFLWSAPGIVQSSRKLVSQGPQSCNIQPLQSLPLAASCHPKKTLISDETEDPWHLN